VEKEPPYVCGLYTIPVDARLAGEMAYMRELAQLAECCESGEFPGYGGGDALELEFPRYAIQDVETVP
jgi:hypothetical protein